MEKATARDQVVEEELSDQEEVRIWVLWCQIVACTLSKCSLLKKKKSVENRKLTLQNIGEGGKENFNLVK